MKNIILTAFVAFVSLTSFVSVASGADAQAVYPDGNTGIIPAILKSVDANNFELKALREQLRASGFELKGENTPDATSVEYSPFFQKGASGIASSELIVSQEIDFPSLYYSRGKAGKKQMSALEMQYELTRRDIFQQTVESFLDYVRVSQRQAYLEKRLSTSKRISELYAKKMQAGDATAIELNRIKLQQMELESNLIANETAMEQVVSALRGLNGYQDLTGLQPVYPDWAIPAEDISNMTVNDTEVKAADSTVAATLEEEKVAKQGWLPKLTLGYRRNTEFDESVNGFIVGAAFPLFSSSSKVKASRARKAAAEIEADNARKKVENEMTSALKELELIRRSLNTYDMSLIDEGYRLLDKSLDAGVITLTDFYTQQSEINEKQEAYIDLQYEYYRRLCVLYRNTLTTVTHD